MRIAIFHLGFFYSGGGEKLVLEEMRGLKGLGHDVQCFAPFVDREACFPDMPEMENVHALLPSPPNWLPMKDPIWVALCCVLIPFMARQFRRFDVLFGANQPGPWFAFVLSVILRKPYVVYLAQPLRTLHPRAVDLENGIRIREGDTRFINLMTRTVGKFIDRADRLSLRGANSVLTNGEHVNQWISQVYGIESETCPAGCYPIPISRLDYEQRHDGQLLLNNKTLRKPYVLLTNRHSPMKRFEYAFWALKSVRRSFPALSLIVTGQETEYTNQLRYLAKGLRIADAVHFVGLLNGEDLAALYEQAALYVYPAPEEDFGMGIIEAMAAGTPVLAWNNGGPSSIIEDKKSGFLIEPYDTDAFAEIMLSLATSPALAEQIGKRAHQRASEKYSYLQHCLNLERVFVEAIEDHSQEPVPDGRVSLEQNWSQD